MSREPELLRGATPLFMFSTSRWQRLKGETRSRDVAGRRRKRRRNKTKQKKINVQVSLENRKPRKRYHQVESNRTTWVPSVRFHGDVGGGAQLCVVAGGDVVVGLGGGGGACVGGGQRGFSDLVLSLVEQNVGGAGLDTGQQPINTQLSFNEVVFLFFFNSFILCSRPYTLLTQSQAEISCQSRRFTCSLITLGNIYLRRTSRLLCQHGWGGV